MNKRRNAFTLVEILVVLAIIAILAAILFPAFNRAKESARQTNCASNLQQIGFAVLQYQKDEGRYPDTLVDILGEGTKVANEDKKNPDKAPRADYYKLDGQATGYLKGSQDRLTCQNDDTLVVGNGARSSYGSLSKNASTALANPTTKDMTDDFGKYVWNYWGYRRDGFAYTSAAEAAADNAAACVPTSATNPCANFVNPALPYNGLTNPLKYSLSNRFAPGTTIITHCVYHRLQTANKVNVPGDLYVTDPNLDGANTRDIILLKDASAKAVDVSQWNPVAPTDSIWQKQTP